MERDTAETDGEVPEVAERDAAFAPHSPWSQPPVHRPAPRVEPEPPKWTRREVASQRLRQKAATQKAAIQKAAILYRAVPYRAKRRSASRYRTRSRTRHHMSCTNR
jgi:hypothetical protein